MKYTIELSKKQMAIISSACELYARLGIGQWREIEKFLPLEKVIDYESFHDCMDSIGRELSKFMISNVDGYRSNLGISNRMVNDSCRDAWDIHAVLRNRLAWDRALAKGVVKEGEPRKWPEMMGVDYDEPCKLGCETLVKVTKDDL